MFTCKASRVKHHVLSITCKASRNVYEKENKHLGKQTFYFNIVFNKNKRKEIIKLFNDTEKGSFLLL